VAFLSGPLLIRALLHRTLLHRTLLHGAFLHGAFLHGAFQIVHLIVYWAGEILQGLSRRVSRGAAKNLFESVVGGEDLDLLPFKPPVNDGGRKPVQEVFKPAPILLGLLLGLPQLGDTASYAEAPKRAGRSQLQGDEDRFDFPLQDLQPHHEPGKKRQPDGTSQRVFRCFW
jgi:hypothetical protein